MLPTWPRPYSVWRGDTATYDVWIANVEIRGRCAPGRSRSRRLACLKAAWNSLVFLLTILPSRNGAWPLRRCYYWLEWR